MTQSWRYYTRKVHNSRHTGSRQDGLQESSSGTLSPSSLDPNVPDLLASVNQQPISLLNRIEAIEQSIEGQSTKHNSILSKLENQENTSEEIARAIEMFSAKYDEKLGNIDSSSRTIGQPQKQTNELEARLDHKSHELVELQLAIANLEQYSWNRNAEIHGVAETDREDILDAVMSIATKRNLQLPPKVDIEAAHRLNARAGKIPPIIVRFGERETGNHWISKRIGRRAENIFINENFFKQVKKH